jgi:hypothetical protein
MLDSDLVTSAELFLVLGPISNISNTEDESSSATEGEKPLAPLLQLVAPADVPDRDVVIEGSEWSVGFRSSTCDTKPPPAHLLMILANSSMTAVFENIRD